MELIETVINSEEIYSGTIVHLRVDTVRLPNGHESRREIVSHRGAVCVVPVRADGTVLLVKQFRLSTGKVLLEIPAGTLEAGEDPAEAAARELEEETGFKPGSLRPLFTAYLSPGYTNEQIHAYLATDMISGVVHLDAGENVQLVELPLDEVERQIMAGEILDAKTIAALLMALRVLSQ